LFQRRRAGWAAGHLVDATGQSDRCIDIGEAATSANVLLGFVLVSNADMIFARCWRLW
jgi:hypothetical protein